MFTIHRCGTVTLTAPRLLLRRLEPGDAVQMHANWASDPVVYRYMTSPIMPEVADVERFIAQKRIDYENPDTYYWGVFLRDTGEIIGMATLTEVLPRAKTANLAYSIGRRWWGQGYAHEAAETVLAFAFGRVGFRKIYGCHFEGNERSGYVLLACGMRFHGRSRTRVLHGGDYLHFDSYEITAAEYAAHIRHAPVHR